MCDTPLAVCRNLEAGAGPGTAIHRVSAPQRLGLQGRKLGTEARQVAGQNGRRDRSATHSPDDSRDRISRFFYRPIPFTLGEIDLQNGPD